MATPLETLPMSTAPSIYDQYRQAVQNLPLPPAMASLMPSSVPVMGPPTLPNVSVRPSPQMAGPSMPSSAPDMGVSNAPRLSGHIGTKLLLSRGPDPGVPGNASVNMPTPAPQLSTPQSSGIITGPKRGEEMYSNGDPILPGTLLGDKIEHQRDLMAGPGEEQLYHAVTGSSFGQAHPFLSKILGGLAAGVTGVGDIGLSTLGGGMGRLAAEMIPSTILGHQVALNRESRGIAQEEANAKDEAQTAEENAQAANLNAQPELKQQAAQLAQDKLDEKREHDQGTLRASLAQHGYAPDENNPGQIRPLLYDEMSPQQQAVTDLKGSQEELADAQKAYKEAQTKNLPLQMQMAQQRIATAEQNARTAIARLGLSEQEFAFHQDTTYDPEPTAQQRRIGDLAQSAVDRVQEMKKIVADHPEYFGPGAGRATKFHAWLGSQDPEAQTFLSAARYLADHSAGVFGSRSVLITQQLEKLTDPDFNPDALNASLDEAEKTARGFMNAGTPHGKGGRTSFKGDSGPPAGMVQVQISIELPGQLAADLQLRDGPLFGDRTVVVDGENSFGNAHRTLFSGRGARASSQPSDSLVSPRPSPHAAREPERTPLS